MQLTEAQQDLMRYIIRIGNYYPTLNDDVLQELAVMGAVEIYSNAAGFDWYRCTESGRDAAMNAQADVRCEASRSTAKLGSTEEA